MEAAHEAGLQDAWTQIPVHATLVNWLMARDAGGMRREGWQCPDGDRLHICC